MSGIKSSKQRAKALLLHVDREDHFRKTYLALKIHLGMMDLDDAFLEDKDTGHNMCTKAACEDFSQTLVTFAGVALKYLGNGLVFLGERVFSSLRNQAEKTFLNYNQILTNYKTRVWKSARELDGEKFDSYQVNVVPYDQLSKRISAVEAVHRILEKVDSIYSAPIGSNDSWVTPECDRAISAMEKIGFQARHYDFLTSVSKTYATARKKQPLYLHKYTPKNIMGLIDRCEKLAKYADMKYIEDFESKYNKCTDKLEKYELTTDLNEFSDKELEQRNHELKIRAARLWWVAHFIKAVYTVTTDIFADIEKLANAAERCIAASE